MRVLLLAQFLPPVVGGVERHVWTLAQALALRDHDVTLLGVATGDQPPGEGEIDGVRVVRARTTTGRLPFLYSDPDRPHVPPVPDPQLARAIDRELHARRYDVVHAHNWIVNSAIGPARRAGVPLVMTLHDYSHVCATARLMQHGRRCPGPAAHRCLPCAAGHFGTMKGTAVVAANALSARRRSRALTRVAAVSAAVADAVALEDVPWAGIGLPAEVIPNFIPDGIVVDDIAPVAAHAPVLFVGDLVPDKGTDVLLRAYRMLPERPPLLLVGRADPELGQSLPAGARLTGPLPHERVLGLFRAARVVVVPSVWADPCPTVVLEAMAAGRPVVAAASGGILDMVVDGTTGLLVAPGDAQALARAITTVLDDTDTATELGRAGRDRARQFTVSAVVARIEQMYVDAASGPKAGAMTRVC